MVKRSILNELGLGINDIKLECEQNPPPKKATLSNFPQFSVDAAEVVAIRQALGMSRSAFSAVLRTNTRTYERYEREGVKGPKAALIKLLRHRPEIVKVLEMI